MLHALRSLLFVPGVRPELMDKALASGADAVVLDLEDAVPPEQKDLARRHVAQALAAAGERLTFVRINHPSQGVLADDLGVLAGHPAQAILVPKVEGPQDLAELDERLSAHERRAGLEPRAISVMVVVESALGLRNLFDSARATARVRGTSLATAEEGDLMFDLGGRWTPAGEALAYARGKFICDSRAAGVAWLIEGPVMNMTDPEVLEAECRQGRNYGFNGKVAIHPRQVAAVNRAFSPEPEEVERARALIEAYEAGRARGQGAVKFRGMMVDPANVRLAEQILANTGASSPD